MNEHDIFVSLGLYLKKEFLDAALCEEIRERIDSHPSAAGYLKTPAMGEFIDAGLRSTQVAEIPSDYAYMIRDRLENIRPEIEAYFDVQLKVQEKPQFLLYEAGGHYAPHRDVPSESAGSDYGITGRIISIVIFLNGRTGAQPYSGGELIFYGLVSDPQWKDYGLPLEAEPGLLVAFRSETLHEVRQVNDGKRYTAVTWLH